MFDVRNCAGLLLKAQHGALRSREEKAWKGWLSHNNPLAIFPNRIV
jgi:hypothetical protein